MQKKIRDKRNRIANKRPLCLFLLCLIAGILIGESVNGAEILIKIIPILVLIVLSVLLLLVKSVRKKSIYMFVVLIGFVAMVGANDVFLSKQIDYSGEFFATIDSKIVVNDVTEFFVKDIQIEDKTHNIRAKVELPYENNVDLSVGDRVKIVGQFTPIEHKSFDTFFSYQVRNNAPNAIEVDMVVLVGSNKAGFPRNFQDHVKNLYFDNLDSVTASVCQSFFLGDKFGVDQKLVQNTSASGLAHVFAVSGLHISFIIMLIFALLKKLKCNEKLAFVIVAVLAFLYIWICSFTPSSIRAYVMAIILMSANILGSKYDKLNSLSLAGSLILIIDPFALLNIGYLLSMSAVLGIILYFKQVKRFLTYPLRKCMAHSGDSSKFIEHYNAQMSIDNFAGTYIVETTATSEEIFDRLSTTNQNVTVERVSTLSIIDGAKVVLAKHKKTKSKSFVDAGKDKVARFSLRLFDIASISIATSFFNIPLLAYSFGNISAFFVLSNLLALPYIGFMYPALVVLTLVGSIPAFSKIIVAMEIIAKPFEWIVDVLGNISFAVVEVYGSVVLVIFAFAFFILWSRFIFLDRRKKIILSSLLISLCQVFSVIF